MSVPSIGLTPWLEIASCTIASVPAAMRWLRVAQREHYLPGACGRFGRRWWLDTGKANLALSAVSVAGVICSAFVPQAAIITAAAVALGPLGLGVKGTSKPMAWTRRMRVLAGVLAGEQVIVLAGALLAGRTNAASGAVIAALGAVVMPILVDGALSVTAPLEKRGSKRWITKASERLKSMSPTVVGITGSYGKTTTKGYVAQLCSESMAVVASPASFNNALGLARTVNEHLVPGTEVLVAEMGAYQKGEIAALCTWMVPAIGVITALGPVHLERFGSEQNIALAKSELLQSAPVNVVNTSHPELAKIADEMEDCGKRVWRCSEGNADAAAIQITREDGEIAVRVTPPKGAPCDSEALFGTAKVSGGALTNIACAVAIALELGVTWAEILKRLPALSAAEHRLQTERGSSGALVLDDTYNSNPAGARLALKTLASYASPGGRQVMVTPGMVELGPLQQKENEALALYACDSVTDLVVVGRTNRKALVAGFQAANRAGKSARLKLTKSRQEAVEWIRGELGEMDVVLYENDLPDHFP